MFQDCPHRKVLTGSRLDTHTALNNCWVELTKSGNVPLSIKGNGPKVFGLPGLAARTYSILPALAMLAGQLNTEIWSDDLAGHKSQSSFNRTSFRALVTKSEEEFLRFHRLNQEPVVLLGVSMGAAVGTVLAHKYPGKVKALISLGCCYDLTKLNKALLRAGRLIRGLGNTVLPIFGGKVIDSIPVDFEYPKNDPAYPDKMVKQPRFPIRLGPALSGLDAGKALSRLCKIECPVFIGHGGLDNVAPLSGAQKFTSLLKGQGVEVTLREYTSSPHHLLLGPESEQIVADIVQFTRQVATKDS